MEYDEFLKDYLQFNTLLINPKYKELSKRAYDRFPNKVKKKIFRHHLMICDYFYHSKYPDKRIPGMPFGFYHEKRHLIDIIPEEIKHLSDKAFTGLIAHETAHFYIDNLFSLFKKIMLKIFQMKFENLSDNEKYLLRHYTEASHELYANWLSVKWGFKEEIEALNKESVIN